LPFCSLRLRANIPPSTLIKSNVKLTRYLPSQLIELVPKLEPNYDADGVVKYDANAVTSIHDESTIATVNVL
jgi:hypothetical protein